MVSACQIGKGIKNSAGWGTAQREQTHGNGQGVVQSYAVVDGEHAWKDRKGVGNEARRETGPSDEKTYLLF